MGNSDQLHKVGDAFAHSYLNSKGTRMMYGSRLWLLPGLGWATLEHALTGQMAMKMRILLIKDL